MFILSWISIKNKVSQSGLKLLVILLIMTILTSTVIILRENSSSKLILKILPFVQAIIFMFAVKCSLNLYEDKFKIRNVFTLNLLLILKFTVAFLIWSFAVSVAHFIIGNKDTILYKVASVIYLGILVLKLFPMFFYVLDSSKKYNPIKAAVRSIIETNGKTIKILFFLSLNLLIIIPIYIFRDILGDVVIIELGDRDKFFIVKSFLVGIVDSFILILISMHTSYVYKNISERKIETRS